jgi:hypothetical protein
MVRAALMGFPGRGRPCADARCWMLTEYGRELSVLRFYDCDAGKRLDPVAPPKENS